MAIDGKRIKKRAEALKERGRVTLYLTMDVYEHFQRACGDVPASKMIEELMKEYLASVPGEHREYYRRSLALDEQ